MQYAICGHEIDDRGFVLPDPASMLVERRGRYWFDGAANAPVRAEVSDVGTVHIVGDDSLDWDGPCFGGTLSISLEEARRVGLIGQEA